MDNVISMPGKTPVLYSFRRCPYAMRARMAIAVSGQTCALREVVLRNKPPEMIEVSPKATVPVMVFPDGRIIEESLGIMCWALDKNDPEGWLTPLTDERDDIDAVLIATPDHWHAIPIIQAAHSGKDIYCEKPLTHNVVEGRKIVRAVTKNKVIFQTGSQQRSEFGGRFRLAAELVRNGRLGKIHTVRIGVGGPNIPCDLLEEPIPSGTDWDTWLGPAPVRPYNQILCPQGIHGHFPAWRKYWEYAGGAVADMGAHHFDIAQWALEMDHTGPVRVEPPEDGAKSGLKLTYANGIEMYHGGPADVTFEGEKGILYVSRGSIRTDPASILEQPIGENDRRVYPSNNHHRNWVDCMKSREQTICPPEIGHRTATICHLTNIGYRLGRPLSWNPRTEKFAGDNEANALLWREPRKQWDVI